MKETNKNVLKTLKNYQSKRGIQLDLGAGGNRQPDFVTLDIRRLPNVDIVWDVQKFPYPLPNECCRTILMSHLWEHIEPKYRIKVMNELWRIMKPKGQLLISSPYYLSPGSAQDPTHYTCPNENTFAYFDPNIPLWQIYKPKPWKLEMNNYELSGNLNIVMYKIAEVKKCKKTK